MVQEEFYLEAAQQGDVQAFNELVLHYQDRVYNMAYRLLQDPAAADDIAQETFITAFRKLAQFTGGNFKAWLLRITINACYDELRRRKRQRTDSLTDDDREEEADSRLISPAESPEGYTQRAELKSAIEHCFEQLGDAFRMVEILVDVEDYSYEEVATLTHVSLGTVKSRVSRARATLRDCLRQQGELLPAIFRSKDNL